MTPRTQASNVDGGTVDEVAASWKLRLSSADVSARERDAFRGWLAQSAQHRAAYDAIDRAWDACAEEAGDFAIVSMREAALRYVPPAKRGFWQWPITAAVCLVAACWVGWLIAAGKLANHTGALRPQSPGVELTSTIANAVRAEFETRIGERSTIRLVDGSVIVLDTGSRISVDLTGIGREVHLLAGRANFDVAHDAAKSFVVYAADRRITALGTAFDVRIGPREVRVTLEEGRVVVDQISPGALHPARGSPAARTQLEPGEQLVAPVGGAARVRGADIKRATSWQQGRLIFEADRLADAIAEMNRYSTSPIVLADPEIGDLKLSGVFRTGEVRAFAHALTEYFSIDTVQDGDTTILRWRK